MKSIAPVCIAAALCGLFSACSSPIAPRAQHADGFLGFLFNQPGPDAVPVERIDSPEGRVTTAHATADRDGLLISGFVRRKPITPPNDTHVHASIVDARGKILETAASAYLTGNVTRPIRGRSDRSSYVVHFASIAPAGSTVDVRLHAARRGECGLIVRVD